MLSLTLDSGQKLTIEPADTGLKRLVGLLKYSSLSDVAGLLLLPCGSIHTWGMRFSIDVVFLNRQAEVLAIREQLPPWRFCIAPRGTYMVLELAAGNAKRTGIGLEQSLKFDSITVS